MIRAEHVFYHALVQKVPRLAHLIRVLDEGVLSKLGGKAKSVDELRPDYFHVDPHTFIALHGEFDERCDHEDSDDRLNTIATAADCVGRTYVFRVAGRLEDPNRALCCRRTKSNGTAYYQMTRQGVRVVEHVAEYIEQCLSWMEQGLYPDNSAGRPMKMYF